MSTIADKKRQNRGASYQATNGLPEASSDATSQSSQFTIGKIDAGIAVLIGESSHLIEFPSLLLPPGSVPGSIVLISCQRDHKAEEAVRSAFWTLQESILSSFGSATPEPPQLKLRNVTQTSVTLEWAPLVLASSKLLSLTIWRNNQRLAAIPNPSTNLSTKISGLELDAPFSFHLVLKTSAGTYSSNVVRTKTHTIQNTSGIRVCFGTVNPPSVLASLKESLKEMKADFADTIQIDTTHFVCTTPGSSREAPQAGQLYQRALQMSIPTVLPSWVDACHKEGRMVPISKHYLGSNNPPAQPSGSARAPSPSPSSSAAQQQQQPAPQQSTPTIAVQEPESPQKTEHPSSAPQSDSKVEASIAQQQEPEPSQKKEVEPELELKDEPIEAPLQATSTEITKDPDDVVDMEDVVHKADVSKEEEEEMAKPEIEVEEPVSQKEVQKSDKGLTNAEAQVEKIGMDKVDGEVLREKKEEDKESKEEDDAVSVLDASEMEDVKL